MRPVLISATLLFTVLSALVFGIACGYAAIFAILRLFAYKPQPAQTPPTAVIATTVSGS